MSETRTQAFKTKTDIQSRTNPAPKDVWPIAIDIGYSSTKIMSPNVLAVFPSYAKHVSYGTADTSLGQVSQQTIVYRDNDGNEYFVGQTALNDASEMDSSASMLYARDRYVKPEFIVIARVAMGLGYKNNKFGAPEEKAVKIATGLPPAYLNEDKDLLKEALCGQHDFRLKIGDAEWENFSLFIDEKGIDVIAQPMGTLYSVATDINGGAVPNAKKYFSSSPVIFDPGFGTLDLFGIKNGYIKGSNSRNDLGMRAVFERTSQLIRENYGFSKSVHQITAALPKGYVTVLDRRNHTNKMLDFLPELEKASKEVCNQALDFLDEAFSYLEDTDYLVITGGTGAAWEAYIKNRYKDMETLSIMMGNVSDNHIDPIYGNVRGYYMSLVARLKRK